MDNLALELESLSSHLQLARLETTDQHVTLDSLAHYFKVAQLMIGIKQSNLNQVETQLKQAQEHINDQEMEIKRFRSLGIKPVEPAFIDTHHLQEEMIQLEHKNVIAVRNVERAEEALDYERTMVAQLTISLKDERGRTIALQEANRHLDEEIKEIRSQLSDQKNHLQSRAIEKDTFRMQITEKNAELNRYVAEIKILGTENSNMAMELESITQELEAAVCELESNSKEIQEYKDVLRQNDETIDELTDERDSLQIKMEDMLEQSKLREETHGLDMDDLHTEIQYLKEDVFKLQNNVKERNEEIQRAQDEITSYHKTLQDTTVNKLRFEISQKDEALKGLEKSLNQATSDFELLSIDWDRLDRLSKKEVHNNLNDHSITKDIRESLDSVKKLKNKLSVYQERHKTSTARIKVLNDQLVEKEENTAILQERIDSYEKGIYGLSDAVHEIKNAKLQMNIIVRENHDYVRQINNLEAHTGDLIEENQELRSRLGIKKDTSIDLSNLQHVKALEAEKSKSLNIRLREEIDRLEEERLQLKAALRLQALEKGERAISLGLTAENLTAVEEYAEKFRTGENDISKLDPTIIATNTAIRPVLNVAQLDKLTLELERSHVDGIETKQQLWKSQEECKQLLKENHELQSVVLEVSQSFISMPHQDQEKYNLPAVNKLIRMFQSKYFNSSSGDTKMEVDKSIFQLNHQLQKEIKEFELNLNVVESEKKQLQSKLTIEEAKVEDLTSKLQNRDCHFLNLPTELTLASTHGYSSLVDQLIACLIELREKEDELEKCGEMIDCSEKLHEAADTKLRMLYMDHHREKKSHEKEISELQNTLKEFQNREDTLQLRISSIESLLKMTENSSDEITRSTIDAHRKLVVMQVNESMLNRRYTALVEVETLLRKENTKLKVDMMDMSKSARETILRLQIKNSESDSMFEKLQRDYLETVPQNEYTMLYNRFQTQIQKTKLLMDREREWVEQRMNQENAENTVSTQLEEINQLKLRLDETERIVKMYKDQTNKAIGQDCLNDQTTIASLNVQLEVHVKRTEFANSKVKMLEAYQLEIKSRLESVEKLYTDSREDTIQLQEELLSLKNLHTGCASKEAHEKALSDLDTYSNDIQSLQAQLQKYKEVADIAVNQVADLEASRQMDEQEKQILLAAVQELQMENDDKFVIGKLHHHILALKMSEMMTLRKFDALHSKCLRLETVALQMEQAKDAKDRQLFDFRIETKGRMGFMYKSMAELRLKFSGIVLLSKYERACSTIQSLGDARKKMESQMASVLANSKRIERDVDSFSIKLAEQEELIEALRDKSNSQKRVEAWHKKTVAAQTELIALKKDQAQLNIRILVAEEECQRHGKLEDTLQQFEEERDIIFQSTSATELMETLPSRDLPIGCQLEASLRLLTDRSRQVKALTIAVSKLKAEKEEISNHYKDSCNTILKKEKDISHLQLEQAERLSKETDDKACLIDIDTLGMTREKTTDAFRAAKSMTDSLQRQIDQKEELVNKYREMIKSIRKEVFVHKESHKAEIDRLGCVIDELRNEMVTRASKFPDLASVVTKKEPIFHDDVMNEMKKLLIAKEESNAELQKQLHKVTAGFSEDKQTLERKISEIETILNEKNQELSDNMLHLDLLRTENQELKEKADIPLPKDLSEDVLKLEMAVKKRNSKIEDLKKVVNKLKSQVMQSVSGLAESTIRQSNESHNYQIQLEEKTSTLTSKIIQLEGKIKQMASIINSHKQADAEFLIDINRVSSSLSTKEKELAKKCAENALLQEKLQNFTASTKVIDSKDDQYAGLPHLIEKDVSIIEPDIPAYSKGVVSVSESGKANDIWEMEKKYIRKVDLLKKKLSEKMSLYSELEKANESIKQSYSRSENDRLRLQSKLQAMTLRIKNAKPESVCGPHGSDREPTHDTTKIKHEDMSSMKNTLATFKSELDLIKSQKVTRDKELLKKSNIILQLQKKLAALNDKKPLSAGNKLMGTQKKLDTTKLEQSSEVLEKDSVEQSNCAHTLHNNQDFADSSNVLEMMGVSANAFGLKSKDELVAVIEHLKCLVAKLSSENRVLRSTSFSKSNPIDTPADLKGLEKESTESVEKLEDENTKFRKLLRREIERNRKKDDSVEEMKLSKQQLLIEVIGLRKAICNKDMPNFGHEDILELKRRIVELQSQVSEKEQVIQSLLNPDADEQTRLTGENRRLKREVDMWRVRVTKLSAKIAEREVEPPPKTYICSGDPSTTKPTVRTLQLEAANKELKAEIGRSDISTLRQELDDLKFNYKESVRLNVKYEEQLGQKESTQNTLLK
ncbi:hypothetical protein BASA61_004212 [Batrachochytrium salamandrivorans]|nr:hypothetical protein BASA61_004212 [Batrachochytrium salamandrivorans]